MSDAGAEGASSDTLAGYDGSPPAASAIATGARLLPRLGALVAHLWSPPFANRELRHRVARRATSLEELATLLEREASAEAERIVAEGVELARAAGWQAQPLARRSYGGEGLGLARLAEELQPAVVVVGARGLSGMQAVLGSVSDMVVHYSPAPVLVVPHPLLSDERHATATGPVVAGDDGSESARRALVTAASLFEGRTVIGATVGDAGDADDSAEPASVDVAGERVVLDSPRSSRGAARRVAERLAAFAAERHAAGVVVGSRGRSAGREILMGSVAMATLHHAQRPVLVVPDSDRLRGQ